MVGGVGARLVDVDGAELGTGLDFLALDLDLDRLDADEEDVEVVVDVFAVFLAFFPLRRSGKGMEIDLFLTT